MEWVSQGIPTVAEEFRSVRCPVTKTLKLLISACSGGRPLTPLTSHPHDNKTELMLACRGCYWAPGLHINPDYVITLKLSSLNCAEVSKEFDSAGAKVGICLYQQHTSLSSLRWHKLRHLKCHSLKVKPYHRAYLNTGAKL